MGGATGPSILHADLDAFYASVEQLLDPSLRGRPIAVGGGVVLAASYEARVFGVRGGMPGRLARDLCPGLRFVGGHFDAYQRLGDHVVAILGDFTPLVERISIDEAFLDVGGATRLFGPPAAIGAAIRRRVRDEVGLAISVGAASTKHLAKVASQVAKPDGLVVVEPGTEEAFLRPLPVGLLWGVGPVTRDRLASVGVTTVGDLAAADPRHLRALLGDAAGTTLGSLAANVDPRRVEGRRRAASVGAQSALGRRPATDDVLHSVLGYLVDRVAGRLRAKGRSGRTLTVRVRFPGLRSVTRSATFGVPTASTVLLTETAVGLARAALASHPDDADITLLGVSVSNLAADPPLQLELPFAAAGGPGRLAGPGTRPGCEAPVAAGTRDGAGAARVAALGQVDRAVDAVRARFGRAAVGFAGVAPEGGGSVPEGLRTLAEREGSEPRGPAGGAGPDGQQRGRPEGQPDGQAGRDPRP